jgi:hypothetical protein
MAGVGTRHPLSLPTSSAIDARYDPNLTIVPWVLLGAIGWACRPDLQPPPGHVITQSRLGQIHRVVLFDTKPSQRWRTGEVLSVPVGKGYLGLVVDSLGEPIDGTSVSCGAAARTPAGSREHS